MQSLFGKPDKKKIKHLIIWGVIFVYIFFKLVEYGGEIYFSEWFLPVIVGGAVEYFLWRRAHPKPPSVVDVNPLAEESKGKMKRKKRNPPTTVTTSQPPVTSSAVASSRPSVDLDDYVDVIRWIWDLRIEDPNKESEHGLNVRKYEELRKAFGGRIDIPKNTFWRTIWPFGRWWFHGRYIDLNEKALKLTWMFGRKELSGQAGPDGKPVYRSIESSTVPLSILVKSELEADYPIFVTIFIKWWGKGWFSYSVKPEGQSTAAQIINGIPQDWDAHNHYPPVLKMIAIIVTKGSESKGIIASNTDMARQLYQFIKHEEGKQ